MAEIKFIDAAYPPANMEGATGLVFYAGGDTPHVWTPAEVHSFNAQYLLPVFVRSNPGNAATGAADAAAYLAALTGTYSVPKGKLVALDSETSIDPAYVAAFVAAVNAGGYPVIDYGSQDDVLKNDNPNGYYWGADWTGTPHIAPGDEATQYVSFNDYDLSEFNGSLPIWSTKPVTTPPPPPTTIDIDGFQVGRPTATDTPVVFSWYGLAGLTRRLGVIPHTAWDLIQWPTGAAFIDIDGYQVARASNGAPMVFAWWGDTGLTRRFGYIPPTAWDAVTWK